MSDARKSTTWFLVLGFLGVVVAVFLARPLLDAFRATPAPAPPTFKLPAPGQTKRPPSPEVLAKPHLDRAQQDSERIIDEHVMALNAFFVDAKKNTRAFATEALSWSSKWRLMADYVPFTDGNRHQKFIRAKFEEHIFKRSHLQDAVKQVTKSYLTHLRSIEGQMLVDLRADMAEFPSAYSLAQIDNESLQAAYDAALARAIEETGRSLHADIATEIASVLTVEVLTQAAVKLGVSAGILGTGAASGWTTLGVGVVVGLIVDAIVSWVWDLWADPRGNLARELDNKLDDINHLIVDGSGDAKGLRARLHEFARARAELRRQAVLELLRLQTGGRK